MGMQQCKDREIMIRLHRQTNWTRKNVWNVSTKTAQDMDGSKAQQDIAQFREFRTQLGRGMFVGGITQEVSSGMLQEYMQQFAQVKHCMLLRGTRNDHARAAKVTFETNEGRNVAMAADDTQLGGGGLRTRTWARRPRERPGEKELRIISRGHEFE